MNEKHSPQFHAVYNAMKDEAPPKHEQGDQGQPHPSPLDRYPLETFYDGNMPREWDPRFELRSSTNKGYEACGA